LDIRLARDLGYRIKLVASADRSPDGVLVRVHPSLAPISHPLAQAGGALNALFIEGARIGRIFVQGPGAGAGPTAAAVAADIADVMTGARRPVFQAPAGSLSPFTPIDPSKMMGRAYLRFLVKDEPGVIAAVSETLAEAGVSIESFLQKPVENADGVPIVLTTHAVAESVLTAAIDRIAGLPSVLERPRLLRIARI
jgi:homoserine dehydrogenase